jgi:hypothetical protein
MSKYVEFYCKARLAQALKQAWREHARHKHLPEIWEVVERMLTTLAEIGTVDCLDAKLWQTLKVDADVVLSEIDHADVD